MLSFVVYKSALTHFPYGQSATFYCHARARIWGLQADPQTLAKPYAHIKRSARLQPGKLSEDLPYGQSGIRRLSSCIRCAPAFCQSSSIHNSLRSIKQIAVWRLSSFSPGKFCELRDFAYGQNLCVLYAKFPPPKAKRLELVYAPLIPTGEEWSHSLPLCGVDRQHSVASHFL